MRPIDFIVIGVILLVIGGAVAYIIKAKKSGKKCIGCPYGDACPSKSGGGCTCGNKPEDKNLNDNA